MKKKEVFSKIDVTTACNLLGADFTNSDFLLFDQESLPKSISFPIKMGAFAAGICTEGNATLSVDIKDITLEKNSILTVLPEQTVQIKSISSNYKGKFIIISTDYLIDTIPEFDTMKKMLLHPAIREIIDIQNMDIRLLDTYYGLLTAKMADNTNLYKREICRKILVAVFYEFFDIIERNYKELSAKEESGNYRKAEIFNKFILSLHLNYKKNRDVAFYASQLYITPKYLSAAVKEYSGKSAGKWIDEMIIVEAKNMLKYSNKSIGEIAACLNFSNQSVFGKYFKKITGKSPLKYRFSK